ncbi:venom phosphodiesterase 2-like isoform X2 [Portunus trituberculatus]|uniref:venom phosphodiesterase 2-like isoform X2 n=1 Tax=Portunus trituberculatus TaxID=210409 RepID=UPI001E1CEEB2|nr:venom phosphodiesterase 2-like isoform X2 [Portunus trituberculatus]
MQITKVHVAATAAVVVLVVIIVLATTLSSSGSSPATLTLPDRLDASRCPAQYGSPRPVLVVSLDGFRADYLHRGHTPTLERLSKLGVYAPYLLPVFPTKTFTNHYSIVTGLYPESHGIVDNVFYDPVFKALFTLKSPAVRNGSWWFGEPIWNTVGRQGKKSATFFWPGSEADIEGRRPDYWKHYDNSISYEKRVSKVLEWLSLPPEERPSWVSLYFEEPDSQGHRTGPQSPDIDKKLKTMDETVKGLMRGLAERELLQCVNILFLSDHGMAQRRTDPEIDLAVSVPNISQIADVIYGASAMIMLKNPSHEAEVNLMRRLSNDFPGKLRAFLKTDLPKRLHYVNDRRIFPIVLDQQPGYSVKDVRPDTKKRKPPLGSHGYDYIHPNMDALFIGYGADLVQAKTVEAFQNIELYNLMCLLANVKPAPNNGTWGALHHLLAAPPSLLPSTKLVDPVPAEYPDNASNTFQLAEGCEAKSRWRGGTYKQTTVDDISEHLPWGPPTTSTTLSAPLLLRHATHVTGYSAEKKTPLWTSFSLHKDDVLHTAPSKRPWLADPRLLPAQMATCTEYETYANITMTPLFPPGFVSVSEEVYFISNAVGITNHGQGTGVAQRWRHLLEVLVPGWQRLHGPLSVVLGPVFDDNNDGVLDPSTATGHVQVPSDLFAVVTRCMDKVPFLKSCDPTRLDVLAFVYPQTQYSWTPASGNDTTYASLYTARVRDVELLTGLLFFPDLTTDTRLALVLRIHRSLWPLP